MFIGVFSAAVTCWQRMQKSRKGSDFLELEFQELTISVVSLREHESSGRANQLLLTNKHLSSSYTPGFQSIETVLVFSKLFPTTVFKCTLFQRVKT